MYAQPEATRIDADREGPAEVLPRECLDPVAVEREDHARDLGAADASVERARRAARRPEQASPPGCDALTENYLTRRDLIRRLLLRGRGVAERANRCDRTTGEQRVVMTRFALARCRAGVAVTAHLANRQGPAADARLYPGDRPVALGVRGGGWLTGIEAVVA